MRRFVAVVAIALVAVTAAQAAGGHVTDVRPTDMQGWAFFDDSTNGPGTGTMVAGPAVSPLGTGSAQLSVTGPSDRQALGTLAFNGSSLSTITQLDYWSFQSGPTLAIALQFDIRYRPTDTAYGGRLVFEPYQQGAPVPAGWTHWAAVTGETGGRWWASKTNANGSGGLCPQSSPCTWAQVRTNWPDATIKGALLFKAGGGWPAFTGNVDAFTITAAGESTTYNFDPAEPADESTNDGSDPAGPDNGGADSHE